MRRLLLAGVLLALTASIADAQVKRRTRLLATPPCVGTAVTTSDNWQTLSAAGANGTTFCIAAGTHRLQSVTPKQDQRFISVAGARMSGARLLTSPSGSNPWTYSGQAQAGTTAGVCRTGQPECQHPEDLWINNVLLHHVSTIGEVTLNCGCWFFNYATDVISIGNDPTGFTVETSVTESPFVSEGGIVTGVWIQGLIIEKYASVGGKSTISAPNGQNWTVVGNEFRDNHAGAVGIGSDGKVLHNYIHHNGQNGIGAYDADRLLIAGNECAYNGLFFDPFWGAAGLKVAYIRSSVLRNNWVHHNFGPGIWCDIDCNLVTIAENVTTDNDQAGIFYEISFNGTIVWNMVLRNGFVVSGGGPAQAGIFIAESQGVEVAFNTVQDCAWGIYAYQEPRGTSTLFPGVAWQMINLSVHDNIVKVPSGGRIGLEQTESDTTYFTAKGNHFEANTYTLQADTAKFTWDDLNGQTFAGAHWQGVGHDTPVGSAVTY